MVQLGRTFDSLPELASSVRGVADSRPFFSPLTFYVVLTLDHEATEYVETLDFTADDDCFELPEDDPTDQ